MEDLPRLLEMKKGKKMKLLKIEVYKKSQNGEWRLVDAYLAADPELSQKGSEEVLGVLKKYLKKDNKELFPLVTAVLKEAYLETSGFRFVALEKG